MKKAVVFTLGCKVNDCESGSLMQGLSELGYEVTDELVPADLYILNTCAVTGEAEKNPANAWRACKNSIPRRASSCAAALRSAIRTRLRRNPTSLSFRERGKRAGSSLYCRRRA